MLQFQTILDYTVELPLNIAFIGNTVFIGIPRYMIKLEAVEPIFSSPS